jgi:protein-serine/threonine kinase
MRHFNFKKSTHLQTAVCKKVLGHGGFAIVKLFQCKDCHEFNEECDKCFVIKELRMDLGNCFNKEDMNKNYNFLNNMLLNEYKIGSQLNHTNIMKTIDIDEESKLLMLEHIIGTDLLDYLNLNSCINGEYLITSFYYILHALEYMHDMGIAHRDIKLENILLGKEGKDVKVIDFGQSIEFKRNEEYKYAHDICGTEGYFPPEYYNQLKYMPDKVDVWCCGVVLYNLIYDCMPWEYAHRTKDKIYEICYYYFKDNKLEPRAFNSKNYKMNFDEKDNDIINDIFKGVFNLTPKDRITIKELKSKISQLSLCKLT